MLNYIIYIERTLGDNMINFHENNSSIIHNKTSDVK